MRKKPRAGSIAAPMADTALTVALATAVATAVQFLPKFLAARSHGKLAERKAMVEESQLSQMQLDNAYHRLETENARLFQRGITLEKDLAHERDDHAKTRERCDRMEMYIRMLGRKLPEEP